MSLTPTRTHYAWTFGDKGRSDFSDRTGIDVPYSTDLHCCPSLVEYKYLQWSLPVFNQGGFSIHLSATWTANAIIHVTRDGAPAPADRVGDYDLRYRCDRASPPSCGDASLESPADCADGVRRIASARACYELMSGCSGKVEHGSSESGAVPGGCDG